MKKNKYFKSFGIVLLFAINFLVASQAVTPDAPAADLVDNSGQERMALIMSQVKHDVMPGCHTQIEFIQSSNLDQDLNLQEIVKFFNPKLVIGHEQLYNVLKNPVSSIDQSGIVELRCNMIKKLVENPEFKQQIEDCLDRVAEQEKVTMELFSNSFKQKMCGRELKNLEVFKKESPYFFYPLFKFGTFSTTLRTLDFAMLNLSAACFSGAATYFAKENFDIFKNNSTYDPIVIGSSVYYSLFAGVFVYKLYDECSTAGKKRVKMHALNQMIHAAEKIESLTEEYGIATQFKMSLIADAAGKSLVDGLKYSRYENKTDYCFYVPGVHTFLYKVYESDVQLAQVFASIAEMDACNAIATKMIEGRNNNHKLCFAQKIDASKPQVISQGFWNVLVPGAVINNITMDQNVILTGPNAGGKTTSIRANLQNIVLAQTYGVAAAESFSYTPFDIILSFLNISDDLINGLSLFASEIKRAKDLLEVIKSLRPDQKLFFALDELFTGTAAEQGEKCAFEFIKKISSYEDVLFVYATHFNKLKELGNQNIGLMNYKVDAPIKNEQGKLVYPFTVSPGASTINIAEDMAKEAGLFA